MADSIQTRPTLFLPQIFSDSTGRLDVISRLFTLVGATGNQLVIPGQAGKILVVLNGDICSVGAQSVLILKSGSGGTQHKGYIVPANTAVPPNVTILGYDWGNFACEIGQSLYADTGPIDVRLSISYLFYTP